MKCVIIVAGLALSALFGLTTPAVQVPETLLIRGQPITIRMYGARGREPVIVSSGDGGWIHLGPHVAETLAAKGFFVLGLDVKSYLERFAAGAATLRAQDEPEDYKILAEFVGRGASKKPILIGVSEGAGLSVLAATASLLFRSRRFTRPTTSSFRRRKCERY